MKIVSLYNTPVRLEEGDLIALEEDTSKGMCRVWIRKGEDLYIAGLNKNDTLEGVLYANSAGVYSQDKSILPKDLKWRPYHS